MGKGALLLCHCATLAQLVEQQFCKLWVVGSNPTGGSIYRSVNRVNRVNQVNQINQINPGMSQDNMIKLQCTECRTVNYNSRRNKKTIKAKIELKKYCKQCRKHTAHKEVK